jgi:hypothetical protein
MTVVRVLILRSAEATVEKHARAASVYHDRRFTGSTSLPTGAGVCASNNCCDFVLTFHVGDEHHGWFSAKLLVYSLVGIAFAAIAYLTTSILASIPVHTAGDAVFFTLA